MSSSLNDKDSIESRNERAQVALTILRLRWEVFCSVFSRICEGSLWSSGYSGLINYYIEKGHAPQLLKSYA